MEHMDISGSEAADRLAIRELVEAYAYCADRRDANGQMALFTVDAHFVVYMDAGNPKPSQELHSRGCSGARLCGPESVCRDDALPRAKYHPDAEPVPCYGRRVLLGASFDSRWNCAVANDRGLALRRHVRTRGRRLAIFRALPLCRLDRAALTLVSL
jgi:SnoaL-like protein